MSEERPTFSEVGEENVRQYLRRRNEEYVLYGKYPVQRVQNKDGMEEN